LSFLKTFYETNISKAQTGTNQNPDSTKNTK